MGIGLAAGSMEDHVRHLIDQDIDVRVRSRNALIAAGRRSIPALLGGLRAENSKLRQACIAVLRALRDEAVLETLKDTALRDSAWMVRNTAIAALADPHFGRKSTTTLIQIAENDSDWINRNDAIKALSTILAAESVPVLRRLIGHSDAHTRVAVARELGVYGDASGFETAIEGLLHEDRRVREKAASALRAIGSPRALPALRQRLEDPNEDFEVKEVAFGAVRHIDLLAKPAADHNEILNEALGNEDLRVRSWALSELVAIGGPYARRILQRVASTRGHRASRQASQALQLIAQRNG